MPLVNAPGTYLRYSEDDAGVDLVFPPYGRHCAGHRSSDEFADSESLVGVREAAGIRVVVLADEYAGRLAPFAVWVLADEPAARLVVDIVLSAEEGYEIVVKPSAAVVPGVNYEGVRCPVFSESL